MNTFTYAVLSLPNKTCNHITSGPLRDCIERFKGSWYDSSRINPKKGLVKKKGGHKYFRNEFKSKNQFYRWKYSINSVLGFIAQLFLMYRISHIYPPPTTFHLYTPKLDMSDAIRHIQLELSKVPSDIFEDFVPYPRIEVDRDSSRTLNVPLPWQNKCYT